jgi:hypothetical protein
MEEVEKWYIYPVFYGTTTRTVVWEGVAFKSRASRSLAPPADLLFMSQWYHVMLFSSGPTVQYLPYSTSLCGQNLAVCPKSTTEKKSPRASPLFVDRLLCVAALTLIPQVKAFDKLGDPRISKTFARSKLKIFPCEV